MPFREKGLHEPLNRELGRRRKKVDLSYHSASHHNPSRKVGEPGILPREKAQRKLFSFKPAIWKCSPQLQHGEKLLLQQRCSTRRVDLLHTSKEGESGVCGLSLSLQRNQDKQQIPLKTELVIQWGKTESCR